MSIQVPISLGMSDHHRALLDYYTEPICKDLLTERVLRKMMGQQIHGRVFDQDDWQEISVQTSSDMKARTLLTLLKKKGPHAFDAFVHVLKETQPCLAAPLLQESGNRTYSLTRVPSECDETMAKTPVEVDTEGNVTSICEPVMDEVRGQQQQNKSLQSHTNRLTPAESLDSSLDNNMPIYSSEKLTATYNIRPQNSCLENSLQSSQSLDYDSRSHETLPSHLLMENLKVFPQESIEECNKQHTDSVHYSLYSNNRSPKTTDNDTECKQISMHSHEGESTNDFDSHEEKTLTSSLVNNSRLCSCGGACACGLNSQNTTINSKIQNHLVQLDNFSPQQLQALSSILNLNMNDISKNDKVDKMVGVLVKKSPVHDVVEALENDKVNRRDVAMVLRKQISSKSAPKLDPDLPILKLKFTTRHKLINELSLENKKGQDWRLLAEELGFSDYIELWRQKYDLPADQLLLAWQVRSEATVGTLHRILLDLDMGAIAGLL